MSETYHKICSLGLILLYIFYTPYSVNNTDELFERLKQLYGLISKYIKRWISPEFEALIDQFVINFPDNQLL